MNKPYKKLIITMPYNTFQIASQIAMKINWMKWNFISEPLRKTYKTQISACIQDRLIVHLPQVQMGSNHSKNSPTQPNFNPTPRTPRKSSQNP